MGPAERLIAALRVASSKAKVETSKVNKLQESK